jgi:transglutaminase-like putative cysteine protease
MASAMLDPHRPGPASWARRLRAWLQPQISSGAREQRDQTVLLLAVAVVVAPHFEHLPLWSTVAIGLMWIWRAWLTQTLKPAPNRFVMLALLVLGTGAVWLEHGTLFGRDPSVNFLLILIGLKVLEMRAHRDVLVIVFLCLFVLQTQFLYDQSILSAAIMLASVLMLFFVLLSVNLPEGDISFKGKIRYLIRVFLLALPLTLALFFLFPRLSSPVLHTAMDERAAGTGLSYSMSPGSISHLLRNDAVALRAKFDGPVPPQRRLYWRGPVFGYFDGRTWSPLVVPLSPTPRAASIDVHFAPASMVDYTVTLEPTQRRDLIALEFAAAIDDVPTVQSRMTPTLELQTAAPVVNRRRYRVRSYTVFTAGPAIDDGTVGNWLQLPAQANPRTLHWASDLKEQLRSHAPAARAGAAGLDRQLVDAVLAHFRQEPFHYDINPPPLGPDSVDQFLFDTRVGFCEHYASSFVVIMRAMGIPARVVTGYQGGEINPVDGYLTVRQSDAHAWAEVWLQNHGWLRVDPTAAVAPNRVERTLRERRADEMAGSPLAWNWMQQWRLNREAFENAWNQWFLSYTQDRQRALISWFGLRPSLENIAAVAVGVITLLLLVLALSALPRRSAREPLAELVLQLRQKLARAGVEVPANMGLQEMETYLASELDPGCLPEGRRLLEALGIARYGRPPGRRNAAGIAALRGRLRRWRPVRIAR